jgi:hypothetical protein
MRVDNYLTTLRLKDELTVTEEFMNKPAYS